MIPAELRARLTAGALSHVAAMADPADMLRAVEAMADERPADLFLRSMLEPLHSMATALHGVPPVIGPVRRADLVRWDAHTVTVIGHDTHTGQPVMARTVRAHSRHPTWRRALQREASVLHKLPGGDVRFVDGDWPVIVCALAGAPLLDLPSHSPQPVALRVVCRLVADLATREQAGLPLVQLGPHELRACSTGARVQCLTIDDGTRLDMAELSADLLHSWPNAHPLIDALTGASLFPAGSAAELSDLLSAALAEHLARTRHDLVKSEASRRLHTRRTRMRALVHRLARYAPPVGHGAVGVDMEGRAIVLTGDGETLAWGPVDGPLVHVLTKEGLYPTAARRLLRIRASAAPSARIQELVKGDEQFTEHACRWVSAALGLRTVQMLLDVPA